MKENNKKVDWLSVFLVTWLILSFACVIYICNSETLPRSYALAGVGQVFLFFGIIAIVLRLKNKNEASIPVSCGISVLGMLLLGLPIIYESLTDKNQKIFMKGVDIIIPLLMLLVFEAIGLSLLIIPRIILKKFKNRCTSKILATCISIKEDNIHVGSRTSGYDTVYSPVWEANKHGKTIRFSSSVYTSYCPYEIGDITEIHYNPFNAEDFYDNNMLGAYSSSAITNLGVFAIFLSSLSLICYFFSYLPGILN